MKSIFLFVLFILALPAFATEDMRRLIDLTNGSVYAGHVPQGYRSVKLDKIEIRGGLKTFFIQTTMEKQKAWKEYVHTSGEYNHVSAAERKRIASQPLKELEVAALLEVEEVYAIYKGNKLIGYFIQVNDYVQAAIYQDGAWYDLFIDAQLNIVEAFEQSA